MTAREPAAGHGPNGACEPTNHGMIDGKAVDERLTNPRRRGATSRTCKVTCRLRQA